MIFVNDSVFAVLEMRQRKRLKDTGNWWLWKRVWVFHIKRGCCRMFLYARAVEIEEIDYGAFEY